MIMINKFGQDSELYIKAKNINGRTCLEDYYFTAPYKIAKPFWDEKKGLMNIIIMSASAGIMEGDYYRTRLELGAGARVALHGQTYTKIHRMQEGQASQFNQFFIAKGAFLDYAPKPTIPYAGSSFQSVSECFLQSGSAFLYSDVFACGRVKRGERFAFREYKNCNKVYYQGDLIFLDHQVLMPSCQNLEGIGCFEGYTHQATLAFFYDNFDEQLLERLYDILKKTCDIEFGLTETKRFGLIVRILGSSADYLFKVLFDLKQEIYECV
ncbi:urease accessory protein [Desulfoscipio geothermicus DSM 3669]|uniref:Urease accessory protein UreD n=2 Tax=Desulfoscipio geothermicus TaxID=39060 RepID=A0A1I6EA02_9FIRM|nr:urease accessory protein [Desulfoscipio geothermicus DSM 3669]